MGIYIEILARTVATLFECLAYGGRSGAAVGTRSRVMICVAAVAVAADLGDDAGSPSPGVFIFLEHEHSGTLSHHEALAARIEREAGHQGVFGGAESTAVRETANRQRMDSCLGAAAYYGVRTAVPYGDIGFADRVGAGCAGCHRAEVHAPGVEAYGAVAAGHVPYHHRYEKRRHPPGAAFHIYLGLVHESLQPAYAGADIYPEPVGSYVLAADKSAVGHCLKGGGDGILTVYVVVAHVRC